MRLKIFLAAISFSLIAVRSPAQTLVFEREISPFPVTDTAGKGYDLAFMGGLNGPRMQFFDEDGDGDPDLFVQETTDEIIFLRNTGSAGQARLTWVTDRYQNLAIGAWYRFRDGDQDGDLDLFCESPFSHVRYYRNNGGPGNPNYILAADTLRDSGGSPIFVDQSNIPEFADIDCDGDDDLFLGQLDGSISLYDHVGVDAEQLPVFALNTHRYQDIIITTGQGQPAQRPRKAAGRHGANTLSLIDLNGDNDLDLLWGDFFASSMVYLENQGNCDQADFDITLQSYPPESPLSTGGFNVPRFADIDGDGDQDLFAGVLGGAFFSPADLNENFYFLRNNGSPQVPVFVQTTTRYLYMMDIGDRSTAALADIDGDGDLDLALANEQDPDGPGQSLLYLFENQGSAAAPELALATDPIVDGAIGFNLSPVFVDIDGDQDLDLITGRWNGNLNHFDNVGGASAPVFELRSEFFAGIDVGNNSTPGFVDIDADGDLDLFVGGFLGHLNFFENVGSPQAADFVLRETQYAQIDVGLYSAPAFADLDGDGDFDLILGAEADTLIFYRNDGSPLSPDFVPEPGWSVPAHERMTPVFGDIDGDGDPDLLAGSSGGGALFYRNMATTTAVAATGMPAASQTRLQPAYPNPFNQSVRISFELARVQEARLVVYSVSGAAVRIVADRHFSAGPHTVTWDGRFANGDHCPSGIYWVRLSTANESLSRKVLLLK